MFPSISLDFFIYLSNVLWATVKSVLCYTTVVLPFLSVCNVGVLWPNGWMDQHAACYGGRLSPGDIALDEDPAPSTKRDTTPPLFGPCLVWPNGRPFQLLLSCCFISAILRTAIFPLFIPQQLLSSIFQIFNSS